MRELKQQFASALLVVLTIAAVFASAINFQQQKRFALPDDGVTWLERGGAVEAAYVRPGSSAEKAGLHQGDQLQSIKGAPVKDSLEVTRLQVGLGAWAKVEYVVRRGGADVRASVILEEGETRPATYYLYAVGVAYLLIGLLVYFRRQEAPKARHFYLLCLASFVFCCFHYTGKLNNFDQVIYYGNVAAGLFAPTLFLHFCLTFPHPRPWLDGPRRAALLYVPATLLFLAHLSFATGVLRTLAPLFDVNLLLDRVWLLYLSLAYLAGAAALQREYARAGDPVVRGQLRWMKNGAILGILPFTLIYVLPFAVGVVPTPLMQLGVISLPIIPLTWAYAIVRHRLMDVDRIFAQGYSYTLATIAILGVLYGLYFTLAKRDELNPTEAVFLIFVATFLFQPIRNWVQETLDRHYYGDRYNYRLTLIEFARELNAEKDLDRMLESVADRLLRTLSIKHVAFFLADERDNGFYPKLARGSEDVRHVVESDSGQLNLNFLSSAPDKPYYLFERTRNLLDVVSRSMSSTLRDTIARLDLTYYIPCIVRGKTIAYFGVSRTKSGEFLAREDVELLLTLSGYVGIAIENSRLYHSLQRKVREFERLKEYSENIVESVNVGILAADLQDRVEGWNSRMEELTGISREVAVGRRLCDLFPADLCARFDDARGVEGVHHIYKFLLRRDRQATWTAQAMPVAASADAFVAAAAHAAVNGNGRHAATAVYEAPAPVPPKETTLNIAVAPLVSKDNDQIGRLIIMDDVTDRAELERQLVQADKLSSIGLLAAGVAHEVNTPLAVISTYAQMLAKQVNGEPGKAMLLEKIAKQTFRASEIVNSLLNFSRTSGGAQVADVDLNRVIRETISFIQHQLDRTQVKVELDLAEPLPLIKGDPGKLQQVFLNLLINARDAMEGGGTLRVCSTSREEEVRIEVEDTGHGISPENLPRVFDPFFTTKAARKGTGLGLAVTYGIVQEHAGSIRVESNVGRGTRFSVDFPVAKKPVHA